MKTITSILTNPTFEREDDNLHSAEPIRFSAIGVVRNLVEEPQYIEWHLITSQIVVSQQHIDSMKGLADYSHMIVLFHMDQTCYTKQLHVPQGKHQDVPEVGIFACRCPYRPNPIGVTTVEILGIHNNIITVKGLDAVNNTPVIDIKPYTPQYDFVCEMDVQIKEAVCAKIRVPDWIYKLTY